MMNLTKLIDKANKILKTYSYDVNKMTNKSNKKASLEINYWLFRPTVSTRLLPPCKLLL